MNLSVEQIQVIRECARDEEAYEKILHALLNEPVPESRPQILAVDDDEHMCSLIRFVLEAEGCEVAAVTSGTAALDHIRHKLFHIIFLDINMPDIQGGEILEKIRASSVNKDTAVVFITGLIKPEEENKLIPRREKYLGKPITVEKLLAVTQEILGNIKKA
ncbi:MAG: response regulator [Verrucomicrobiota bacterium]